MERLRLRHIKEPQIRWKSFHGFIRSHAEQTNPTFSFASTFNVSEGTRIMILGFQSADCWDSDIESGPIFGAFYIV